MDVKPLPKTLNESKACVPGLCARMRLCFPNIGAKLKIICLFTKQTDWPATAFFIQINYIHTVSPV